MIEYRKGNVLTSGCDAIAHGCNCRGLMGAGFARQIKDRYPDMYDAYKDRCAQGDFRLGGMMTGFSETGPLIYNLATQYEPGPHAQTWAIAASFGLMVRDAIDREVRTIGMPWIGCGIGGLRIADLNLCLAPYATAPVKLVVFEYER